MSGRRPRTTGERGRTPATTSAPSSSSLSGGDPFTTSSSRPNSESEEDKKSDKKFAGNKTVPRVSVQSSSIAEDDDDENTTTDNLDSPLLHPAPTSSSDFTSRWLLFVMRQYFTAHHSTELFPPKIGHFSVDMAGTAEEGDVEANHHQHNGSHSVLSTSYKVMVDVPDPPPNPDSEQPQTPAKIHHLFVKVPPKQTAKFERMVRRNRTLEHEVKVYHELLRDLQAFIRKRVGDTIKLRIPTLYHGFTNSEDINRPPCMLSTQQNKSDSLRDESVLVIEDLTRKGFTTKDWFKYKLNHEEVLLALTEMAKFHACGLAYRMSLKEEIDEKYVYLEDDLYTSNMSKELLAKYLDSYLHFLTYLDPSIQEHVLKLRKISGDVFQLLFKLRRPTDPLGTRFNTICHGDMWMGNLMFKPNKETGVSEECYIIDFHSAQFLSPATDLAHLLLTSTTRQYRKDHWDEVVKHYYDVFNRTLAEFGLVLRHLGTTYQDFLYEVKRALRGQFLCVAFIIPIVVYCGPTEWRFERRRGSSCDRKNTVRHLMQMMSIIEHHTEDEGDEDDDSDGSTGSNELKGIPMEFIDLYNDEELKQTLIDLIHTAADLDILDFQEFCKHIDTPKPMWSKTQATTGKHIPVY